MVRKQSLPVKSENERTEKWESLKLTTTFEVLPFCTTFWSPSTCPCCPSRECFSLSVKEVDVLASHYFDYNSTFKPIFLLEDNDTILVYMNCFAQPHCIPISDEMLKVQCFYLLFEYVTPFFNSRSRLWLQKTLCHFRPRRSISSLSEPNMSRSTFHLTTFSLCTVPHMRLFISAIQSLTLNRHFRS